MVLRHAVLFILVAFFLVGFLGLCHFITTGPADAMTGCPLVDASTVRHMNPLEHIAAWQGFFTALPSRGTDMMMALLPLLLACVLYARGIGAGERRRADTRPAWLLRRAETPLVRTFLEEAFSDGILNPKIL